MERIKEALDRARRERSAHPDAGPHRVERSAPSSGGQPAAAVRYTQTRVVPTDPEHLAANRIIANRDRDPAADAFRMLRTRVLQLMRAHRWNSLAVTSPGPGEGKSVTALNLAISLSREVNHTVLLVDLDLRTPSVHRLLGLQDVEVGIGDYMFSELPLSHVLLNPSMERLVILPGRDGQEEASEMLSAPKMRQLIDDITHRYPERLVIFDLPPVCTTDDVLAFSPLADAFLLVVRDGGTRQPELRQAAELLRDVNLVGTVLTMADDVGVTGL
ncbi:MAG: CpsD/CapB family tyrosine-protein kinase [Pseudomonadota bacterium]